MVDRPLIMSRQEMAVGSDSAPSEGDASARDDEALIKLTGTVKWFDATRGFGFIVSEGAKGDILVHFSVLKEHDRRSLPEGALVECLVAEQERGLQARKVLSIDLSKAIVPEPPRRSEERRVGKECRSRRAPHHEEIKEVVCMRQLD